MSDIWSVPAQTDTSLACYLGVAHASTVNSAGWILGTVFYGNCMHLFQDVDDDILKPPAHVTGLRLIG